MALFLVFNAAICTEGYFNDYNMPSRLISKFTMSALFVIEENLKEKADFFINYFIPEFFKATKRQK